MAIPPPTRKPLYNRQLDGVYGEFGAGAGVQAFYLQSAIIPGQLNWVSLISDIQGSERWPVPDLFQRDVDNERVGKSLLPYLKDMQKIKFFNPLTLTVLPMDENGTSVLTQMPKVVESATTENDRNWKYLERKHYYRIRWVEDHPQYAMLEWSDTRSRLVAIDGQHRLSALKRFLTDNKEDSHQNFMSWRIPVVIVSFRAGEGRDEPPSVLEVVRSIFVYINTEAKEVSEARKILLSDESVNDVCAQELLERAHTNDLLPRSDRKPHYLPLLFYDWRGEEAEKRQSHAPAAVKSVEEIRNWFRHYILGDDFGTEQETALGIDLARPLLHQAFHDRKLSHTASKEIRKLIRTNLLPAVAHLLEDFVPYRFYIADLRALEQEYERAGQSDLARHAFYELRFGTNHADASVKDDVKSILDEIKARIDASRKKHLLKPIDLDIGMRGVTAAFGCLRRWVQDPNWTNYSELFTRALNRMYEDGWLNLTKGAKRRKFLLHIAEDHNETIINYRLEDMRNVHGINALGAYVELLVAAHALPWPKSWGDEWLALREDLLDTLNNTIVRGYKKQIRPQLREKFPSGGWELTNAVRLEAEILAGRQIRRLERELDRIEKSANK